MDEYRSWLIEIPGRPAVLNTDRARHWTFAASSTKQTRTDAAWLAKQQRIPHLDAVAVIARPIYRDRRTSDVGAVFPAVKAAIDGLRDAGVLDDDDPTIVVQLTFDAPLLGQGRDALEITIEEVGPPTHSGR